MANMGELRDRLPIAAAKLDPWIGLHTGPAVVETTHGGVLLAGKSRNLAARLQKLAEPGEIVCSGATYRLIGDQLQCASLGRHRIPGVSQEVEAYAVHGLEVARSPVERAASSGLTPLTGRDHEVALLKDRWEHAREGMGQVVLLIGEPGLGKSRLVYTLKQYVLGQVADGIGDVPVIEWRCSPNFQNTPLYPAVDFYERALEIDREATPHVRFQRVLERLREYGLDRPEIVSLWASLLSLPAPEGYPPLSLSPTRQREETFRMILEWLRVRAARQPILFVVEDLHWVDASTLEFLRQFLAEGLHDSILAVFTFRPEFQTPWPAVAHQTTLALNRLTRRQVGELIERKTGGSFSESVVDQIYERAGGVPLFVEEFTTLVQESLAHGEASEMVGRGESPASREIPATLQDLLMARLDRLETDPEVTQLAAALGREFTYELLSSVATIDSSRLKDELNKLVRGEILQQKGRAPDCKYRFKHALLEDAAYNSLVKAKRRQLHARIADVLEARFPHTTQTQPELLAHHLTAAESREKAIGYWLKAGLRSRERSAEHEAIGHLTKGLELVASLPESAERDANELQFLNPLGTANIAAYGYAAPEVGPVFQRARMLCERIGQPRQLFTIVWGNWAWHLDRGEYRLCMDLAAEAIELAKQLDDPGVWMEALFIPGLTLIYRGDFSGARDHFVRALDNYEDPERTLAWSSITGQNSSVTTRCYLSHALWHLGFPDQALRMNRKAVKLARSIGQPFSLAYALYHVGWLNQYCRLGKQAEAAGEESIHISTAQGFAFWHAAGQLFKAGGMLLQHRVREGLPLLHSGLHAFQAGGAGIGVPYFLSVLADAYKQNGEFQDARRTLDEALAIGERNDERFQEAELYRLKGELFLTESRDELAAERCFQQAIATARSQRSLGWELRATTSLARLRQQQGRVEEARTTLSAVYDQFSEGFTTPDLVDARLVKKALERPRPRGG
jgi:predicted ATPase